jgi:hypothetical protein
MPDVSIAPKQKNKRLSQIDRDALVGLASRLIEQTEDRADLDAAYVAAASAVRAAVEAQFPPKDMKVLAKYEAARTDACIQISRGNYHVEQFCFREDDSAPMRPARGGCHSRVFSADPPAVDAVDAYKLAETNRKDRIKKRLADYRSLIQSVNTFNDVAAVWPEANELRLSIVGSATAMLVLSNDVIERIQKDAAQRLAA